MIDDKDRLLLSDLQKGLPISDRPFSAFGPRTGTDAADVLLRVEKLRKEGFLSGIGAFWDQRVLRYQGTWAAMRFGKGELDEKARIIGGHPGVIYSAERDHELNFWFFITAPRGHDLGSHLRVLGKQTEPAACAFFPLKTVLKGVGYLRALDGRTFDAVSEYVETVHSAERGGLSLDEMRVIRALQENLPVTDEPYRKVAEGLGMPAGILLKLMQGLLEKGYLKRVGARLAVKAEAPKIMMFVAWQIPEEKAEAAAKVFAEFPEVIYADLRSAEAAFPYPVFSLIQAEEPAGLEVLVRRIEDRIGKWPNRTVRTVREFKKIPLKYFPKELDAWWVKNRLLADPALDSVPAT